MKFSTIYSACASNVITSISVISSAINCKHKQISISIEFSGNSLNFLKHADQLKAFHLIQGKRSKREFRWHGTPLPYYDMKL